MLARTHKQNAYTSLRIQTVCAEMVIVPVFQRFCVPSVIRIEKLVRRSFGTKRFNEGHTNQNWISSSKDEFNPTLAFN